MADLAELLETKGVLLADGATGTNLFEMGLTSGDAPEMWLEQHPDRIRALHRSFVEAGSDIILTNSFGCNARRLMLHGMQDRARELNRIAAQLAREEADKAGRPIVVAGSVGPTGDLFAPLGPLTEEDARAVFREQIAGLKDGGVDVIWIETMSAAEEIRAAALAAIDENMAYVFTASFDTAGRTMMGIKPEQLVEIAKSLPKPPLAIGANCGVGASDLLMSVLGMAAAENGFAPIIVAKANCGIPQVKGDKVEYTGTPELMARYAHMAIDAGARIVGGCCGTAPEHLRAMRAALDSHHAGARPTLETVTAAIGPLVAPPNEAGDDTPRRGRGRRRG
ncbi:MAG: betaine--homocysteine S-methyltransferase [Rhodobiaceae bacterium]|nr:betaine--homocysteine S-methyltransferase [Rhodobiaceae bacterium]MCC0041871.1 betaine--homocysteine S-methyltransferase [Rhodobiaceae bacterium]